MAQANDQQMQQFANERIRVRAEQFRAIIVTRRQFVVSAAVSAASLVMRRAESRRDFRNVSHFGFIEASDGTRQYVLGNVHGDSEPCSEGVYREYLEWFLKP